MAKRGRNQDKEALVPVQVHGDTLSPFCQPPPRKSFSYSNLMGPGSGCCPGPASSLGAQGRMALQMSSAFMSDQTPIGLSSPFGGWAPVLERRALEEAAAAGVQSVFVLLMPDAVGQPT